MGKLYYFEAPTFDINPESEIAPKLGSIFPILETLTGPLNQYDPVSPPANLINTSSIADFGETTENNLQVSAGLQATVAYSIGGTSELVYTFASNKQNVYRCEVLETVEFTPTLQFVTECVRASLPVQSYLEHAFIGRKRVYMVTGLKIATGFSRSTAREIQQGPVLNVGVDTRPLGKPVQAGPELDLTVGGKRTVAHGRTANKIIFAYRVIRVKMKRDGEASYKHKSGGKYGVGDDEDDSDEDSDDERGGGKKEDKWELEPLDEANISEHFPNAIKMSLE